MKRVPPADPGQLPLDLGQGAGETSELSQAGSEGAGGTVSPIAGRPSIRIGRGPRVVEADVLEFHPTLEDLQFDGIGIIHHFERFGHHAHTIVNYPDVFEKS